MCASRKPKGVAFPGGFAAGHCSCLADGTADSLGISTEVVCLALASLGGIDLCLMPAYAPGSA